MGHSNWIKLLNEAVAEFAGEEMRAQVMAGSDEVIDMDEKSRALWVKGALDRLDALVPDESSRYEIMTRCSCDCADGLIGGLKQQFAEHKDIDLLLEQMYKNPFYVRPVRKGRVVFFTKVAAHPAECDAAETDDEKKYLYCHCGFVRAAQEPVSKTHCFCSAGWYRRIFAGIFETDVKVVPHKSVLQGDDSCQFAMHLPDSVRV
jgi:hypothetical protein